MYYPALCLTYTAHDVLTLSDGAGSEHHAAEAGGVRCFWGVSVEEANHMLRGHRFSQWGMRTAVTSHATEVFNNNAYCTCPTLINLMYD